MFTRSRRSLHAEDNHGQSYDVSSSGTNDQGNHYCSRDYGNDSNSYHCASPCVHSTHVGVVAPAQASEREREGVYRLESSTEPAHRLEHGRLLLLLQLGRFDLYVFMVPLVLGKFRSRLTTRADIARSESKRCTDHNDGSGGETYISSSGSGWTTK